MTKSYFVALSIAICALTGCTASSAGDDETATPTGEDELKSADCPAAVDVLLAKPSIASDTALKKSWAKDMASYESDPNKAAQDQLTDLASHVALARAEDAVKLHGTLGKACFYATTDAQTGKPNGYHLWFAKTGGQNGQLQLRITRDVGTPNDTLFFSAPLTSLSPTSVTADPTKSATVRAQHTESGYHGEPEGPNAWIGSAKVTTTLSH